MSYQDDICEDGGILFPALGVGTGDAALTVSYTLGLLWVRADTSPGKSRDRRTAWTSGLS